MGLPAMNMFHNRRSARSGSAVRRAVLSALVLLLAVGCGEGPRERWQSNYVEANGIRLHYWRTGEGSGKPVIVLAHGMFDNGLCWMSLAMELERRHDLILYDARGHGLSGKPESGYGIEDHARDLAGLIEGLGLEDPALLGHSMGSATVAVTAALFPDLPAAVMMLDPVWLEAPPNPALDAAELRRRIETEQGLGIEELMEVLGSRHPDWPFEDWRPLAEAKTQVSLRILETVPDLATVEKYFPRIEAPVLVLKADAEPAKRERHQAAVDLLAAGRLVHVERAGHHVHRDKPFETRAQLRRFLGGRPLWEAGAKYRRAGSYSIEVEAEGYVHETGETVRCGIRLDRKRGNLGRFVGEARFEGCEGVEPPVDLLKFDRPPEVDRAWHRARTVDRDGERSEAWEAHARLADETTVEYRIDRKTGVVDRVVIRGPEQWKFRIVSTEFWAGGAESRAGGEVGSFRGMRIETVARDGCVWWGLAAPMFGLDGAPRAG